MNSYFFSLELIIQRERESGGKKRTWVFWVFFFAQKHVASLYLKKRHFQMQLGFILMRRGKI